MITMRALIRTFNSSAVRSAQCARMSSTQIKLYTNPISPPGRSVQLAVKALNVEVEVVPINLLGNDTLKPEYLKHNPQHTIPMIEDEGKFIWDSQAINVYLATKHGTPDALYPSDPYERAKVNAGLHFNSGVLFSRLKLLVGPVLRDLRTDFNQESVEYFLQGLQLLEDTLTSDYFTGDQLTLADLSCVSTVSSFHAVLPLDEHRFPKTVSWLHRLSTLTYYQEANQLGLDEFVRTISAKLK